MQISRPSDFDFNHLCAGVLLLASAHKVPLAIYVLVLAAMATGLEYWLYFGDFALPLDFSQDWFSPDSLPFLALIVGWFCIPVAGDFFLYLAIFAREGGTTKPGIARLVPFFALTVAIWLGEALGLLLLVLPGVLLIGRLSIASAILLAEECSFTDALKESWNTVRGSIRWILLGYLLAFAVLMAASLMLEFGGVIDESARTDIPIIFVEQLLPAITTASFALIALSAYFGLRASGLRVGEVFS